MKKNVKTLFNLHDLKVGSVIMRTGTVTPESIELESEELCDGWDRIRNREAHSLDRSLRGAGWQLFFLPDSVQAVAVGSFDQDTIRTAASTLLAKIRPQMFNCVELTEVSSKHFVGIPYVHVTAHARHIQRDIAMDSFVTRRNEISRSALESREDVHVKAQRR